MKKIIALIMALAMMMSLTMIAFAGEPEPDDGGDAGQQMMGQTSINVSIGGEDNYEDYEALQVEWTGSDGLAVVSGPYEEYEWDVDTLDWVLKESHEDTGVIGEVMLPTLGITYTNLSSAGSLEWATPIINYTARMWALMVNGAGRDVARAWSDALVSWQNSVAPVAPAIGDGTPPTPYSTDLNDIISVYVDEDLVMSYVQYLFDKGTWDPTEENSISFDLGFEVSGLSVG